MAEFTKGEWKIFTESEGYLSISPIDAYIDHGSTDITEEDRANARLIAAAPDLYAACKEIDHFFNESVGQVCTEKQAYDAYHNSGTSDRVKAALTKADKLKGENDG